MAEPKTRPTGASVEDFIAAVPHPGRREDGFAILELMRAVTGEKAVMWGPSIVGFGTYRTPTGDWPRLGFSPRKANLVLYVMFGADARPDLLERLGKVKTGSSCLYLNRLKDVDQAALRELVEWSWAEMARQHP